MVNDLQADEKEGAPGGGEKPDYRPEKEGSGSPQAKPETTGGDAAGMPKEKSNE